MPQGQSAPGVKLGSRDFALPEEGTLLWGIIVDALLAWHFGYMFVVLDRGWLCQLFFHSAEKNVFFTLIVLFSKAVSDGIL